MSQPRVLAATRGLASMTLVVAASAVPLSAIAEPAHISEFVSSSGGLDLERIRESGYSGAVDLDGRTLAELTGASQYRSGPCGPTIDDHWSSGFGDPANFDDAVRCAVVFENDLIVGGHFEYGHTGLAYVARWDGSEWTSMAGTLATGPVVYTLAVYDGELVAGGEFDDGLVRWTGTDWAPLGGGVDGFVYSLHEYSGDLIVGGSFTTVGTGTSASNIAAWDGTGWSSLSTGISAPALDFVVYDGDLIVAGEFDTAGGSSLRGLARWDGSSWSGLGSGLGSGGVGRALAVWDDDLVVGGAFLSVSGVSALNIARYDGTSWSAIAGGLGPTPESSVIDLGVFDHEAGEDLYAVGEFLTVGTGSTSMPYIARTTNGSSWATIGDGLDGAAYSLLQFGDVLTVGGNFNLADDVIAGNFAICVKESGHAPRFSQLGSGMGENLNTVGQVTCAILHGSDLYVAGRFEIDGQHASIARWDGGAWTTVGGGVYDVGSGASLPGSVYALKTHNNGLLVGGDFDRVGSPSGATTSNLAYWNGSSWETFTGSLAPGGTVRAFESIGDGWVAVGGQFTQPYDHIYKIRKNSLQWLVTSLSGGFGHDELDDDVFAMRRIGSTLYVGGAFSQNSSGSKTLSRIAAFMSATNQFQAVDGGISGTAVYALGTDYTDTKLVAGGRFTDAGSATCKNVAMLDGGSWTALGSGLEKSGSSTGEGVFTLGVLDQKIVAGGRFDRNVSGYAAPLYNLAYYGAGAWIPIGEGITGSDGTANTGEVRALKNYAGKMWVGGDFTDVTHGTWSGTCTQASRFIAQWNDVSSREASPPAPGGTSSLGLTARPTPFNPHTSISFEVPAGVSRARVRVFDTAGRMVRSLHEGALTAGKHTFSWDGSDRLGRQLASGVYFVDVIAGARSERARIVMLK